jgi:hypothetical protein
MFVTSCTGRNRLILKYWWFDMAKTLITMGTYHIIIILVTLEHEDGLKVYDDISVEIHLPIAPSFDCD